MLLSRLRTSSALRDLCESLLADHAKHVIEIRMVSCVRFLVQIQDVVTGSHDDARTELRRPPTQRVLSVASSECPCALQQGVGSKNRDHPETVHLNDVCGKAILIEKDIEWHGLILHERLRILAVAGADRRHADTGRDELVVSIADLTGPLAAGQSAEVSKEEDHMRVLHPQVTQPVGGSLNIGENHLCERLGVEGHGATNQASVATITALMVWSRFSA